MKGKEVFSYIANALGLGAGVIATDVATNTLNEILGTVLTFLSIIGVVLTTGFIVYDRIKIMIKTKKEAEEDGIITEEEQKAIDKSKEDVIIGIKDGVDNIKDAVEKGKGRENDKH